MPPATPAVDPQSRPASVAWANATAVVGAFIYLFLQSSCFLLKCAIQNSCLNHGIVARCFIATGIYLTQTWLMGSKNSACRSYKWVWDPSKCKTLSSLLHKSGSTTVWLKESGELDVVVGLRGVPSQKLNPNKSLAERVFLTPMTHCHPLCKSIKYYWIF